MSKQVAWTKSTIDAFAEEALLSDEEIFILETRAKNWTVSRQAMYLNCSESRVHTIIRNLKRKYDVAQKNRPDVMPPRVFSADEIYMDNH